MYDFPHDRLTDAEDISEVVIICAETLYVALQDLQSKIDDLIIISNTII